MARRCECQCFHPTKKHLLQPDEVQDQNWSRLGPMGPLLDPKLYPVKVGKPPESATMRSGQPNRFLAKVNIYIIYLYQSCEVGTKTIDSNSDSDSLIFQMFDSDPNSRYYIIIISPN